jgi:hypothetical protein
MRVSFLTIALLTSYVTAFPLFPGFHGIGNQTNDANERFSRTVINLANHPFTAPTETDSRTPCPALNALSNHGFLPRDGKEINPDELKKNLMSVYGLTFALATGLVESGWQKCGKFVAGKKVPVEWHEFAKHNAIEHDASLAHADTAVGEQFAPTTTDQGLLQDLLSRSADGQFLQMEDFAQVRVEREDALAVPLGKGGQLAARGETALILSRFGDEHKVAVSDVQTFLGESRLPDNYTGPTSLAGFVKAGIMVTKIGRLMDGIRASS